MKPASMAAAVATTLATTTSTVFMLPPDQAV